MAKAIRPKSNSAKIRGFLTQVWSDVPARRSRGLALGASLAMSGAGHGALAFAAGLLTRSLAQPVGARSEGIGLLEVCYVGLAAACVKGAGSTLLAYLQARTAGEIGLGWRRRFFDRWSEGGLPDAAPRVLAIVAVRLAELEAAVVHGALASARALAQLLPIVLGLIFVSPLLAGVGTLVLIPFGLGLAAVRRKFRRANERAQARAVELHEGVDALVNHLDLWRTFGATRRITSAIEGTGALAVASAAKVEASRALLSGANEVLGALALVGSVALAQRAGASLGDGNLVAFAAICFMAYRPLRDLGDARGWVDRGRAAHDALGGVMTRARAIVPTGERAAIWPERRGALQLSEFGARDRGPRTSTLLPFGDTLAVLGANGSGKTTLLRTLLGLEPAVGALVYDGVDLTLRGVGPDARPFAWVPQEAPIVAGTLLDNVTLACGDASRARLALAELGAERLVARANERVGPGGSALSGGERRLVAMARALATDLPVILMDEPTEGLDDRSRARVLASIAALSKTRTIVLVTHHADVAALASRVISLDPAIADPAIAAE